MSDRKKCECERGRCVCQLDKHDLLVVKYMGVDWFFSKRNLLESEEWREAESRNVKNCRK